MNKFYNKISLVLISVFFVCILNIHAQDHNLIQRIPLDNQVELSDAIIEGEVISKTSYWDEAHKNILTSNIIKVYKVFKGEAIFETVEIITPGGVIDLEALVVSHSLNLRKGDIGVFMLEKNNAASNTQSKSINKIPKYRSFSAQQGFYKYDLTKDKAVNSFSEIKNIEDNFQSQIISKIGKLPLQVAAFSLKEQKNMTESLAKTTTGSKSILAPGITSFSATNYSAGTKSVLTINGSGFGSNKGTVGFSNANYGGALHTNALNNQILSWTDSKIEVEIPDEAGTGTIKVNTTSNGSIESSNPLTIDFSQINLAYNIGFGDVDFQTQHVDLNGEGGITWTINNSFYNSSAQAPFEQAMDTWVCQSGINWKIGNTTTSKTLDSYDGVNLVTMGSLPAGNLGQTFSAYSACYQDGEIKWYVTDTDMIFNSNINWNFSSSTPQFGEIDFQSVAVHELGHAHQLGHVIDSNVVMHYSLSSGKMLRSLSAEDMEGSNDIQYRNSNMQICSQPLITQTACASSSLSTNKHLLDENLTIYPNPASNILFIKKRSNIVIDNISIYSITGGKIVSIKSGNYALQSVDLSHLSSGMYLLEFDTEYGRRLHKIMVNK
ncbi:T9SS type A sorting domain-containing protein [Mariniflexile sp. HNIBRBA6329]|uniref:T9SS type A sorting domain-containing protein n=1 Tax=Mariniflexile sp. HNIBRBA6329 TaxID=3373088 RepID=UPI003745633E